MRFADLLFVFGLSSIVFMLGLLGGALHKIAGELRRIADELEGRE